MAKSNPKDWGEVAEMMCNHTDTCARPRFMRGRIGWTPACMDVLDEKTWFLNLLYYLVPALFGARVIVCVTCYKPVFLSKTGRRLFDLIRVFYTPDDDESIMFIDEDVKRLGDFKDTLDLEYMGDENG